MSTMVGIVTPAEFVVGLENCSIDIKSLMFVFGSQEAI